jgi:hypothetical protein
MEAGLAYYVVNYGVGETIGPANRRSDSMKNRIAMWAGAGFLVAAYWAAYALATFPHTNERMRDVWILASITCPINLASHLPLSLYWVLVANAATYALVGLIVETFRQNRTAQGS